MSSWNYLEQAFTLAIHNSSQTDEHWRTVTAKKKSPSHPPGPRKWCRKV